MTRTTLPSIEPPPLEGWPAPVATWQHTGASGQFALQIDLTRGVGRRSALPDLALTYTSSNTQNGPFGLGWSPSLPSILRGDGRHLPRYCDAGPEADPFAASDLGELVPALQRQGERWLPDVHVRDGCSITRYRPRLDAAELRIEQHRELATGELYWSVTTHENTRRVYGRTAEARIANPANPGQVAQWLLQEEWDRHGHGICYEYKREDLAGVTTDCLAEQHRCVAGRLEPQRYLKRIRWSNARPFVPGGWLFEILFDYGEHAAEDGSLTYEEQRPWPVRPDAHSSYRFGFDLRTRRLCRRILLFDHLGARPRLVRAHELAYDASPTVSLLTGVTLRHYRTHATGAAAETMALPTVTFTYSEALPPGQVREVEAVGGDATGLAAEQQWLDLDSTGLPGLVSRTAGGALYYRRNLGSGRLAPPAPLPTRPALTSATAPVAQMLAQPFGDSRSCLMDLSTGPGYQERTRGGGWQMYRSFAAAPTVRDAAVQSRSLDLDGDGRADLLLTGGQGFCWHPFAGREGWAPAREVGGAPQAWAALADRTGTVLLADMTGDGLADLVQVQPGSLRYWPNLGHGRFGEPVQMAGAPLFDGPDLFDPARVRLVDIDGSGAADLLYIGRTATLWYPNQAGNRFGPPRRVAGLPPVSDLDAVAIVDLLGTGTGCLVYSPTAPEQPARFIELVGGQRPHLLVGLQNGQGLQVQIAHAPSTRLALADEAAGRPWRSHLPSPVWVVTEVRQIDQISGLVQASSWSYRHGYYDDRSREMRGFACIEQRDLWLAPAEPVESGLPDAPVRVTRTWYHTGAFVDRLPLEAHLAREFFAGDPAQPASPDLAVEDAIGLAPPAFWWALQGQPLRTEIYGIAEPSSADADCPYRVTEYGYLIRSLQPPAGSFAPPVARFAREEVVRDYERQPDDPRQLQRLSLAIDPYGHSTRTVEIAYPRCRPAQPEQGVPIATLTERTVAHQTEAPDCYLTGAPVSERRYQIEGLPPCSPGALYRAEELSAWLEAAPLLQRRLLAATDHVYWNESLTEAAPLGLVGPRALPHHQRRAAFTPDLLAAAYGDGPQDLALLAAAGYERDGDLWWARTSAVYYEAAAFYQPVAERTPLGAEYTVRYDDRALFVVEARDPVGNLHRALYDEQALAPARLIDPNGATLQIEFDALGLPASLSVQEAGASERPLTVTATIRRDLLAWQRSATPMALHVTTAAHPQAPPGRQIDYLDGYGRPLQRKQLAEPDGDGERWVIERYLVATETGAALRLYAPTFVPDAHFTPAAALASLPVTRLRLDALERTVQAWRPDGALTRSVYRAWQTEHWDENDAVRASEWLRYRQRPAATAAELSEAEAALSHADTPAIAHLDPAGRPFLQVEVGDGIEPITTRTALAPDGEVTAVVDARSLLAEQRTYDLLGRAVQIRSAASGLVRILYDAVGEPLRVVGARAQEQRLYYDPLSRLQRREVRAAGGPWRVVERLLWGEQAPPGGYHRGRLYLHFDGAGLHKHVAYDCRGNLLQAEWLPLRDPTAPIDWRLLEVASDTAEALELGAAPLLADEGLHTAWQYDEQDRPVQHTAPDGSLVTRRYGLRGLVESIVVTPPGGNAVAVLQAPTYDAAGRRSSALLGNGVQERSIYNVATGLLSRRTTRAPGGECLRDLTLRHDAVGNVLSVADGGQQWLYFAGLPVSPDRSFRYDAHYRLIEATGREAIEAPPPPDRSEELALRPLPHPNDRMAVRRYTERYRYDLAGNLTQVEHLAPLEGNWTRRYRIAADGDRLVGLADGDGANLPSTFRYDAAGNATTLGGLPSLIWDEDEHLTQVALGGGGTAYYRYDGAGRRAIKLMIRQGGQREERLYGDAFERFRRQSADGSLIETGTTLQIDDGEGRLLLMERHQARDDLTPALHWRYQHGDQVGSCWLETDARGQALSCEEFRPFGATAYRAAQPTSLPKRYRFGGQECDAETGLNHHGARYYAPWLCRWISADPAGMADGANRYAYTRNNPATRSDPSGTQSRPALMPAEPSIAIPPQFASANYHVFWSAHRDASGYSSQRVAIYPAWCTPPECHTPPLWSAQVESGIRTARPPHQRRAAPVSSRRAQPPPRPAAPAAAPSLAQPPTRPAAQAAAPSPVQSSAGAARGGHGFWGSGGDLMLTGTAVAAIGAAVLLGSNPLGWGAMLLAGSAVVSGSASASFGFVEYASSHRRTAQQEERFHEAGVTMGAVLTPGGALGAAVVGAVTRRPEDMATGAQVGAAVEGAYALTRAAVGIVRFVRSGAATALAGRALQALRGWLAPSGVEAEQASLRMLREGMGRLPHSQLNLTAEQAAALIEEDRQNARAVARAIGRWRSGGTVMNNCLNNALCGSLRLSGDYPGAVLGERAAGSAGATQRWRRLLMRGDRARVRGGEPSHMIRGDLAAIEQRLRDAFSGQQVRVLLHAQAEDSNRFHALIGAWENGRLRVYNAWRGPDIPRENPITGAIELWEEVRFGPINPARFRITRGIILPW